MRIRACVGEDIFIIFICFSVDNKKTTTTYLICLTKATRSYFWDFKDINGENNVLDLR